MKKKKISFMCFIIALMLSFSSFVYANNGYAFSAGKGYYDVDMSSTVEQCANHFSSLGYSSYYATDSANYDILNGYFATGQKRLESAIVLLTGHGMWDRVSTTIATKVVIGNSNSATRTVGTNSVNWPNVQLAIFLACLTGQETSNYDYNIAYNVFRLSGWTTTSMGWRQSIEQGSASSWINNFCKSLRNGYSVSAALNSANSKSYSDSRVKDIAFYGNPNLVLKRTKNSYLNNIPNEKNIIKVNKDISFDGNNNSEIIEYLKEIDTNFNISDYKIYTYKINDKLGYYGIDFIRKINNYETNSSYYVAINKNKVLYIADNKIDIENINLHNNKINEDVVKKNAIENLELKYWKFSNNTKLTPANQSIKYFYDINKNKAYIRVFTDYKLSEGDGYGCNMYEEEL